MKLAKTQYAPPPSNASRTTAATAAISPARGRREAGGATGVAARLAMPASGRWLTGGMAGQVVSSAPGGVTGASAATVGASSAAGRATARPQLPQTAAAARSGAPQ